MVEIKSMDLTLLLTLFSACLVATVHADLKYDLYSEQSLINVPPATRGYQQSDPAPSVECFNWYLPTLNNGSIEYKNDHAVCLLNANERRAQIEQATYGLRDEILTSGNDTSSLLEGCASKTDAVGYYGCVASAADENVPLLNEISDRAADILAKVEEQYNLVEVDQNRCVIGAKRKYKANIFTIFNVLQKCLSGGVTVPTPNDFAIN